MVVESFSIDHTKVKAPYVRLCGSFQGTHGDIVYKYDVRFKQPNTDVLTIETVHTLEHLLAVNLRQYLEGVIDISPMGCQTGFYLVVMNNNSFFKITDALAKALEGVINTNEIPAANEVQCGNAKSHDLAAAKAAAKEMLEQKDEWGVVFIE